jgi:hypothetical protein
MGRTHKRERAIAVAAADEWVTLHARPDNITLTHSALYNLTNVIENAILDATSSKKQLIERALEELSEAKQAPTTEVAWRHVLQAGAILRGDPDA